MIKAFKLGTLIFSATGTGPFNKTGALFSPAGNSHELGSQDYNSDVLYVRQTGGEWADYPTTAAEVAALGGEVH